MIICSWEALSFLVTLVGTIAVIVTVYEMKKQRYATYLPQLLFHNTKFYIGTTQKKRPIVWQGVYKRLTKEERNIEQSTDLLIKLTNVGLAAAVNVKIDFHYDFRKIEETIDNYKSSLLTKKGSSGKKKILYLYEKDNNLWTFNIHQDDPVELSVLPVNEEYYIKLPETIKSFINTIIVLHHNDEDEYYDIKIQIPAIIDMNYYDISLNKINRKQEIICNVQIMNIKNRNSDIRGTIVFIEKKRKIHLTISST
jgi:hypothetical protein